MKEQPVSNNVALVHPFPPLPSCCEACSVGHLSEKYRALALAPELTEIADHSSPVKWE
jgi:hypothetical protein